MVTVRLLYICRKISNSGGTERILISKINSLIRDYGYEVSICTYTKESEVFFDMDKSVILERPTTALHSLFSPILFARFLFNLIRKKKYDIIISLGGLDMYYLPLIRGKSKILIELHFPYSIRCLSKMFDNINIFTRGTIFFRHKIDKFVLRQFDRFIVLTKKDKILWNLDGVNNLEVIKNFVESAETSQNPVKNKIVVSVGRLSIEKGYADLLKIWSISKARTNGWMLHIWGDGPLYHDLSLQIQNMDLSETVSLCGITKNVLEVYSSSAIYVCTSFYEGFGLSLIEAMQCSLPVISFNCPNGPSEIIKDNQNGYLIENRSILDYSSKLDRLCLDSEERALMSKTAYQFSQRYIKQSVMPYWDNIFKILFNEKNIN